MFEGERAQFFGQIVRMRAHKGAEGAPAAAKLRHPCRSVPRRSRPLLPVEFLSCSCDVRATECLMRSGAAFGELVANHERNKIPARRKTKVCVVKTNRAGVLAI